MILIVFLIIVWINNINCNVGFHVFCEFCIGYLDFVYFVCFSRNKWFQAPRFVIDRVGGFKVELFNRRNNF